MMQRTANENAALFTYLLRLHLHAVELFFSVLLTLLKGNVSQLRYELAVL